MKQFRLVRLVCPHDPTHGSVLPLAANPRWGYYCPHRTHDGLRDTPQTRAFFTTKEVEQGSINETGPAT